MVVALVGIPASTRAGVPADRGGGVMTRDDAPTVPDDVTEAVPLAQAMAAAYNRMALFYRDQYGLTGPEADARARALDGTEDEAAAYLERTRNSPADQVSWFQLQHILERDPDAMRDIWQAIKAAARDELDSGHRTAQALDWGGRPWERARFLAIRDSFRADCRPRPGFEAAMVDMAAEAFGDYLAWSETLHRRAALDVEQEERDGERHGHFKPQRLSWSESLEEAARHAERAHARFLRTIKALGDLRRAGPVYVGQAGQVNVGQQQVNLVHPANHGSEREPDGT